MATPADSGGRNSVKESARSMKLGSALQRTVQEAFDLLAENEGGPRHFICSKTVSKECLAAMIDAIQKGSTQALFGVERLG
jgi:hypothetical protein